MGHFSATAPRMGKKIQQHQSGTQSSFKHWGSSLSLESDPGLGEITRRTLRPPSPKETRTREAVPRNPKPVLPLLTREEVQHPQLKDYLEKPRLVSTLHCISSRPGQSPHHAKRLANGDVPVYR